MFGLSGPCENVRVRAVLLICAFVACAPRTIVYLPTPHATPAPSAAEETSAAEPTSSPQPPPPTTPQAPAEPRRQDFAVPTLPVGLARQGTVLVWSDLGGAVWTMPTDGSKAPTQLSEQHRDGFVFRPFIAGERVLGKVNKDLVTIDLATGQVQKQHITGIGGLPEEAVGDDTAAFVTLFNQTRVLRIADGTAKRLADVKRGVLGLHAGTLYVASYTTGDLIAIPAAGGSPHTIAKGLAGPTGIAADDNAVYVRTEGDHRVIRIDLASGARETLGENLENADVLVVDNGSVYTMSWPNKLVRLRSGSAPAVLADDLQEPRAIVVDDVYVYVTTAKPPRIVRIPK